ncbi:hypothetical protein GCM10009868_19460 [Terrabacter aerolatus]|uniref:Oxygen sensor histidine kinase NreB n=1 Tax=Terrabacter aerolatus TaxID=422442 RepID=A0A512D031_9MICO|nr:ATP-binding protein [Terrabacter aerolatus]GEO29817.1 hypothetical protein TAE01_16270 [Terrabacter aerolatus]
MRPAPGEQSAAESAESAESARPTTPPRSGGAAARPDTTGPGWTTLADGPAPTREGRLPTRRRMLLQLGATAIVVPVVVVLGASWAASRLAEREAVNDAAHTTNLLALTVVQPTLQDGLLVGDATAVAAVDRVVRERVLPAGIVRVKLWRPDGTIVYADDARLVGQRFTLAEDQREALSSPQTRAEVSDLARSENEFERYGGKLLEVYRPVWTPSGSQLLFEVYGDYAPVQNRAFDLWRGLAGVLTTSLLLLLALLAPVLWRLLERLESARAQREDLLRRAVDASDRERRRIAADLHDGPVQDLVASSLAVSGAAARVGAEGRRDLEGTMTEAATTVRGSVASLRTLLVDLYPDRLADAGLAAALSDLARPLTARGIAVDVEVDHAATEALGPAAQQAVHRVARECLRNVVRHAEASHVRLRLGLEDGDRVRPVVLRVEDDGNGFDPALQPPAAGHLGLRVVADLASDLGAVLRVRSAPGHGTEWLLALPATGEQP